MMAAIASWFALTDQGTVSNCTVGGSAAAITLTCSPTVDARVAGQRYVFKLGSAISGATTIAVDGLASGAVQWNQAALVANDFAANDWVYVTDDGTNYQLITPPKLSFYAQINNLTQDATGATGDKLPTYDISASAQRYVTLATIQTLFAASQAQQETGTSNAVNVTPGRQHNHASAAKAWVNFTARGTNGAATVNASYNVDSVTRTAAGVYDVTFTADFSSTTYACVGTSSPATVTNALVIGDTYAAGVFTLDQISASTAAGFDGTGTVNVACYGDQ